MKIAIKVLTEWDRLNVIAFFEKHYPNCNYEIGWTNRYVEIGNVWVVSKDNELECYTSTDNFTSSDYTILEGVPKDLELPKVEENRVGFWQVIPTREQSQTLKIYRVEFDGVYPIGNCLVLAAYSQEQAEEMASNTIAHTDKFVVNELTLTEPQIIEYLSGDY
jgi:hypothetical protein